MTDYLIYGVYSGAAMILIVLVEYFTGLDRQAAAQYLGWLPALFLIIAVVMGLLQRRRDQEGTLPYGQGVGTSMMIALTSGVIGAIFMYLYLEYINPELVDFLRTMTETKVRESMASQHKTKQEMEMAAKFTGAMFNPGFQAVSTLILHLVVGLVAGLIASAFIKSKAPEPRPGF